MHRAEDSLIKVFSMKRQYIIKHRNRNKEREQAWYEAK